MEQSLLMKTEALTSLNFMIYIQNIYLNQCRSEEDIKFPYFSTIIAFKDDFELNYKELWNEVLQRISKDSVIGEKIFYKEKDLFYQQLFENNADSLINFYNIYKTFQVWWNSFAGRFSIEKSIDDAGYTLYLNLANSLKQRGTNPQRSLDISLIYDECLLGNVEVSSYFAVLPIKAFFVKPNELVTKLQECIY